MLDELFFHLMGPVLYVVWLKDRFVQVLHEYIRTHAIRVRMAFNRQGRKKARHCGDCK
jgi:hypothetical protein